MTDTEADIRDRLTVEGVAPALIDHWLDTARLPDIGMTPHEAIGAGHADLVRAYRRDAGWSDGLMRIGTATVTYYEGGAYTTYDDGTSYAAQPHDSHHYHVIAHRCGYGGDVLHYAREHEVCHHIVSEWIGGHTSRVLWPLAHGREPDPFEATAEEALAMTFQRWLRANERPIIGGVDWNGLKRRALALLDA